MSIGIANMEEVITKGIEGEIERVMNEEIEKTSEAIKSRIRSELGRITLGIMKHYEFETMRDRIIITVKNDL
jgi:hypothetical protein